MEMQRLGDLEINQDLEFEHRSWQVQRAGWVILGLVVVAALLGLFGGAGPLSTAELGAGSTLAVTYARFARYDDPIEMELQLQPGAAQGDEARIWVDAHYLEKIQIQSIQPEPERVLVDEERVTYVFPLGAAGAGGRVVMHIMPQTVGRFDVRVGLEGGPEHGFTQIVYP